MTAGCSRFRTNSSVPGWKLSRLVPRAAEQLELAFGTQDIRVSAPMLPAQQEVLRVEAGGYEVISDLPTSADLLKVVESSSTDGRESLLQSCIQEARFRGDVIDAATLPDEVVKAVIDRMAEADPQADVQIELACPVCAHHWSMTFDILTYLWSEIEDWAQRLLLEVHTLALAYGWSERDILAMSPRRRRLYLEMVGPQG